MIRHEIAEAKKVAVPAGLVVVEQDPIGAAGNIDVTSPKVRPMHFRDRNQIGKRPQMNAVQFLIADLDNSIGAVDQNFATALHVCDGFEKSHGDVCSSLNLRPILEV